LNLKLLLLWLPSFLIKTIPCVYLFNFCKLFLLTNSFYLRFFNHLYDLLLFLIEMSICNSITLSSSISKGHSDPLGGLPTFLPFPGETTMVQQTTHRLFVFVQYTEESGPEEGWVSKRKNETWKGWEGYEENSRTQPQLRRTFEKAPARDFV